VAATVIGRAFCALVLAVLLAAVHAGLGRAQEAPPSSSFDVVGTVANGTPGGGSVAGLTVQLVSFTEQGAALGSWEATTDADGGYRFDAVPAAAGAVYIAGTEYQGASYVQRLDPGAGVENAPGDITVYEAVGEDPGIHFDRSALIVSSVDSDQQTITMLEVHGLNNPTQVTFLPRADGPGGPLGLLVFGLPQHAFELQPQLGLNRDNLVQIDRGFASLDPIRPGQSEIAFSYKFPFSDASVMFRRTLRYPVQSFRVLAAADGVQLMTEDGTPATGRVSVGGRDYQEIQMGPLAAGSGVAVQLGDLPARPSLHLPVPISPEPIGALGAIAGATAVLGLWWRSRGEPVVGLEREAVLDALVALDAERAAGRVTDAEYDEERERLLALTQEPA
jgi:hypothetical protein